MRVNTSMENIHYNEVLIHAARKGEVAVMQELLEKNVDLNCKDEKGYTPLIIACYNNQAEAVKFLLDNGADIKWRRQRRQYRTNGRLF